jgi:alpha-L-fucosidase 2
LITNEKSEINVGAAGVFALQPAKAANPGRQAEDVVRQACKVWNEALPVGNGRLGAMIYGDPAQKKFS